jgi:ArsR family transcriptional regulator
MPKAAVDRMFKAFSDPTRLRILHLLRGGEACVGDLVAILRVPQPTASRHLAHLRRAGLITARKRSYWTYYALKPAGTAFHRKLIECLDTCFRDVPALSRDAAAARRVRAKGGCCPL